MAHQANGWDWPDDRPEAAPVKIKLDKAKPSTMFHDEATVSFALGDRKFHGWMPDYAVNVDEKWLKAFIVGDFANGDWYVLIPHETFQSTEYLRVPIADQNTVVVDGWW